MWNEGLRGIDELYSCLVIWMVEIQDDWIKWDCDINVYAGVDNFRMIYIQGKLYQNLGRVLNDIKIET